MNDQDDTASRAEDNPFEAPESRFGQGAMGGLSATSIDWSPTDAVAFGWECVKRDPMVILVSFVGLLVMNSVSFVGSFIQGMMTATNDADLRTTGEIIGNLASILNIFVSCWITLGITRMFLNVARGQPAAVGDVFSGGRYWSMLGAHILFGIGVVIGFLLLIVPGVIILLGWSLFTWLIVDQDQGAVDSLTRSWELTKGHKGNLFVYLILAFLIGVAGMMLCCVGYFVAYPLLMLGSAYIYLCITGQPVYRAEA